MSIRLGELLVEQGALTLEQRDEVLRLQEEAHRPFGVIAEEYFGVSPNVIEDVWAKQYAMIALRLDPLAVQVDQSVLDIITKRQAWQFGLIPVREHQGEMEFVTSMECMARALRFVGWRMPVLSTFYICDLHSLKRGLALHYPFESLDAEMADKFLRHKPAA